MLPLTPQQLDALTGSRYRVEGVIGEGGMGVVYLAQHRELGSRVAIKVLAPHFAEHPALLARFKREAGLAAQLSHPNIVPVIEVGAVEGIPFLVMPYVAGVTLAGYLREHGPLALDEVERLLQQIGNALAFAHSRGIIHRDVKPANILLEEATGRWLLTDFGVAHIAATAGQAVLTASDAIIGTPAYMAPEQQSGAGRVDGRSDLFALAAVAFEALTGATAKWHQGVPSLVAALKHARRDLRGAVAAALTAPLAAAPEDRPASIEAWLRSLAGAERRRGRRTIVAALLAAAVAAFGWWLVRPTVPTETAAPVVAVLPFRIDGPSESIDLDSVLSWAFASQLQTLPDHRIIEEPAARAFVRRRYAGEDYPRDTLLEAARSLGATHALLGRARASGSRVDIRAEWYDAVRGRLLAAADTAGPLDSLHALVSGLVIATAASRLAEELVGTPRPSLPEGLAAVTAYFEGARALRRADLTTAIARFNRVIELDASYAPAHLKRMLATLLSVRPTRAVGEIRSALDVTERYGDRLDPISQRLLDGYRLLIREGDLEAAATTLRRAIDQYPEAMDGWFLLGLLQLHFPLMGASLGEARFNLSEAVRRDPTFAVALGRLVQVAVMEGDLPATRTHLRRYLDLDSTSVTAELMRAIDTLLFRPASASRVLASYPSRPTEVLEYLALGAGELRPPPGTRPFAIAAVDALLPRAATPEEAKVAFRMRLAAHLGSAQPARARELLRSGRIRGVPQSELDRWLVLSVVAELPRLGTDEVIAEAAQRLLTTDDEPLVSRWLVARWGRQTGSRVARSSAEEELRSLARQNPTQLVARSLIQDLEALDALDGGDTARALVSWEAACSRYQIERVHFGLVASLWPLRLDRMRVMAALGQHGDVMALGESFGRMAGFVDQVGWQQALLLQAAAATAAGDTTAALRAYGDLHSILFAAEPEGVALRDSIARVVTRLQS